MRRLITISVTLVLWAGACLSFAVFAQEQKEKETQSPPTGEEIMAKVRENQYSETMEAVIQMTLVDKNGKEQVRRFKLERKSDNVLIRFLYPPDIKDTGYLVLEGEEDKEPQVFVYFPPPTDDYRQINVEDESQGQSFLGSDFDVTDFQVRNPEETVNRYLRTEKLAGLECYVVESVPRDESYKYGRVVSWIRTDYWLPLMVRFYDREGRLAKEMKVFRFDMVGDKRVIKKSQMENLASKHKTVLEIENVAFDVSFPDDNFTVRRLTRP